MIGTGYHESLFLNAQDLIEHGYGELTLRVSSLKDNTVKVEVLCGKSYVYFIKKNIQFDPDKLL